MKASGYLIDAVEGAPLSGATVRLTDTTGKAVYNQAIADANGFFQLEANNYDYLLITHTGIIPILVSVTDANDMGVIAMERGNSSLPPVIVTPNTNVSLLLLLAPVIAFGVSEAFRKNKKLGFAQALVVSKIMSDPVLKWVFIAALVALGFIVVKSFNKILQFLGLKKKPSTADLDKASENPESFWSPAFWQNAPPGSLILNEAQAQEYIKKIYEAIGWFNDDEEAIIGVFKNLRTQSQASYLADKFYQKYNSDLLTFLRGTGYPPYDRLSDDEVHQINEYLEKLPQYKV